MQRSRPKRSAAICTALLGAALASLMLAAGASAELTGDFVRFKACPAKTEGVSRCVYSETTGGEVTLGSKTVPIEKTVILQGGYTKPAKEGAEKGFSKIVPAVGTDTLSKTPQKVPGGLVGLVPPESAPPLVKAALELALENGFTGVNTTLEVAGSASDIRLSELNLALAEGVALILPLKAKLENPFLGTNCYVGSDSNPIIWNLEVDPAAPGAVEFLEEGTIIEVADVGLQDDSWSAPGAKGCGGLLSFLVDPIINATAGLPSASGKNSAYLENTIFETTAFSVRTNDEEN
jgi:hypothetical protein